MTVFLRHVEGVRVVVTFVGVFAVFDISRLGSVSGSATEW